MKSATNIHFEFQGGFKDGDVEVEGPTGRYRFLSDEGRLGARFREHEPTPDGAIQGSFIDSFSKGAALTPEGLKRFTKTARHKKNHVYEVVEREERADATVVRLRFVGKSSDKPPVQGPDGAVELWVELHFAGDRPNKSDEQARDAILRYLKPWRVEDSNGGVGLTETVNHPTLLAFSGWFKDEEIASRRIAEAIQKFLPGVEFIIMRSPEGHRRSGDSE